MPHRLNIDKEFININRKHTIFVGATLDRFDFRNKNLQGVNFTDAYIRGADFTNANLRGCIFVKANLARSCFFKADCEGADFSGADMSMTYLRAANFTECKMWSTVLRCSIAKYTNFTNADMRMADIVNAMWLWCDFTGIDSRVLYNVDKAIFKMYIKESQRGKPIYDQEPGCYEIDGDRWGSVGDPRSKKYLA